MREREEKLAALVDRAMDAIVELDDGLRVTRINPAAANASSDAGARRAAADFARFLTPRAAGGSRRWRGARRPRAGRQRSLWIPGGLEARRVGGELFPAEATLSRFDVRAAASSSRSSCAT